MKYLIILLFIACACSSDDDPDLGCAQLKQQAQEAYKAHRSYTGGNEAEEQRLYNIYKNLADQHFAKRCP